SGVDLQQWKHDWLNESFATQMAAMAMREITEFDDTWHGFFVNAKRTAYARDSQVTTHPIEMPIASTRDFFTVFDAITYQKGSSVLKQLAHYVGEENYRRGVSAYLKDFSYATTELDDFVGHIERASGVDLQQWKHDWLNEAGYDTLQVRADCGDGVLKALHILQTAAAEHPILRAHRVEVALHAADGTGTPLAATVIPAAIAGADTVLPDAAGLPCPALVNPNYNDWTYAKFALDEAAAAGLEDAIARLPEPLERSMFLAALYDRALAGQMPIAAYVRQASELAQGDDNVRVQQQISATLISAVDLMQRLRPETAEALATLLPALEEMALSQAGSGAGDDIKRIGLNTFLGIVGSEHGLATVERLLDGDERIPGIELSADLRWQLLSVLSAAGRPGAAARLALERQADTSDYGAKRALTAAAAWPELANKTAWLDELQHPDAVTGLARQRAVMAGLFPAGQTELQLASLDRILDGLPALARTADPYFLSSYASVLLTPMCRAASVALLETALDAQAGHLDPTSLRFLREAEQADRECLALRHARQ
ncbi:MAG TPA: M1 family aminopeptidase, partial [Woeseiaceae bacterium]|nr:M1 family aminopeptidase [Woeseiaceae bacterium]